MTTAGQRKIVRDFMSDGNWHTLAELTDHVPGLTTSISARIRELRTEQYGGHIVETMRDRHTFYYRVVPEPQQMELIA